MKKLLLVCLALVGVSCSSPVQREICNNGLDDDGNGKTDCADPDCSGQSACEVDAGYYGTCAKCGQACTIQKDCFGTNFLDDRPLAVCRAGKCESFAEAVQMRIEYNTASWGGVSPTALGAIMTRWISKTSADGGTVNCAAVQASAPAMMGATQPETSGRFVELGVDVTKVAMVGGSIPNPLTVPFVYTSSGSDYLIYTEAWSGGTDSSTRLPTGTRRSSACVETGTEVAPVTKANDCNTDGGTCRILRIPLPAP